MKSEITTLLYFSEATLLTVQAVSVISKADVLF